jgi:hypothetical protein
MDLFLREFIGSLQMPGAQGSATPYAHLGPKTPQLKKLSPDQAAECRKYLKYHKLAALLIPGKEGISKNDYQPGLDGVATTIEAIVQTLLPLTLLNPVDELRELVVFEYSTLVVLEIAAMRGAMKEQGRLIGPTDLEVKAGDHKAILTWTAAPEATGYNVYRGKTSGGEDPTPIKTSITATSFIDTGLVNDKTYFYRVTATTSAGETSSSYEVSATPQEGEDPASVELDPKGHSLETQVKLTIGLRAKDESSKIEVLPDAELTVHVGADGKPEAVEEAQINLIKAHIEQNLNVAGKSRKIEIEATVSLDGQVNLAQDALKSLKTAVKGELEVKLGRMSLKASLQVDPTKRKPELEPGFAIVLWTWK